MTLGSWLQIQHGHHNQGAAIFRGTFFILAAQMLR